MGLSREIAKALLIDSATGCTKEKVSPNILGYGVVPQHINDIIKTPNDEIKFVLYGVSEQYDTYTYNIPVHVPRINIRLLQKPQCVTSRIVHEIKVLITLIQS